jgi:protocatechuate 3,4-dioxygenase beta subunit
MTAPDRHGPDAGLEADLYALARRLAGRRRVVRGLFSGGIAALAGLYGRRLDAAALSQCVVAPEETNGPFPADGSRSPFGETRNVLTHSGIVRGDITPSFGASTTRAQGVSLQLQINVAAVGGCRPLAGQAVYVWHCDRDGDYSMYAPRIAQENYLRGVQVTDERGQVTFRSIFPACYDGRYPHVHVEVYPSLAAATRADNALVTTQLALPRDTCAMVYTHGVGYHRSLANFAEMTAAEDMVFSDSSAAQLAAQTPTMTGSVVAGYQARATLSVDPNAPARRRPPGPPPAARLVSPG